MAPIRKFWWLALIAGGWLLVHGHAHAAEMRYPKRFTHDVKEMASLRSAQPYQRCNYNTRTCERGLAVNEFPKSTPA